MTARVVVLALLLAGCGGPAPAPAEPAPVEPAVSEPPPAAAPPVAVAPPPREPEVLPPAEATRLGIGAQLPPIACADIDGQEAVLHQLMGEQGMVIVLTSLRCPIARLYAPGLVDLVAKHSGVRLLIVDVAERDSEEDLKEARQRLGWVAPVVIWRDAPPLLLARALKAQRTTECFVLDREGVLRYRGAIDDQYGQGYRRAEPRRRYLDDALRAVRAGEPVAVPATTAPGCVVAN